MRRIRIDDESKRYRNQEYGFMQSHGGRERFDTGEWGRNSEFGRNSDYHESDSYIRRPIFAENDFAYGGTTRNNSSYGFTGIGPKGYIRSDERIREDACDALFQNYIVDASDIDVAVNNGVIVLSGTVHNRESKREAEACVELLAGVKDVQNQIRIRGLVEKIDRESPRLGQ
jgi:hypothetical protein